MPRTQFFMSWHHSESTFHFSANVYRENKQVVITSVFAADTFCFILSPRLNIYLLQGFLFDFLRSFCPPVLFPETHRCVPRCEEHLCRLNILQRGECIAEETYLETDGRADQDHRPEGQRGHGSGEGSPEQFRRWKKQYAKWRIPFKSTPALPTPTTLTT